MATKRQGDRSPDAAAAAGDQSALPIECSWHA
jgi:hypothetical protein